MARHTVVSPEPSMPPREPSTPWQTGHPSAAACSVIDMAVVPWPSATGSGAWWLAPTAVV